MKKSTKVWLIVAGGLIIAGVIIFALTMSANKWNFPAVIGSSNETRTYEINEDFDEITILSSTEDIAVLPAADGRCKVVFDGPSNRAFNAAATEDKLEISTLNSQDLKQAIENYDFGIGPAPHITVYLPARRYGQLAIYESTGDIDIEDLSADGLSVSVTTGTVRVSDVQCGEVSVITTTGEAEIEGVTCEALSSKGSTGDIAMRDVIASGRIAIERGTGNVSLDGCDAGELEIRTGTGDVTGTLLTDKEFVAKSDTGDIDVPEGVAGTSGRCTVTTGTGDIIFTK